MGLSRVELIQARRQIHALIQADPVDIVLKRRQKIDTPGGGWRWGTTSSLTTQTVTLVPFKRRFSEFLVNTELGDLPDLPYTMIGYHNLNAEKGDTFVWQGDTFEIREKDPKTEVRVMVHVDYYGGSKNG